MDSQNFPSSPDPMEPGQPLLDIDLPSRKPFRIWAAANLATIVLGWLGIVIYMKELGEKTAAANAEYKLAGEATFVIYFLALFLAGWFLIFFLWDLGVLLKWLGKPRYFWVSLITITVLGVFPALLSFVVGVLSIF